MPAPLNPNLWATVLHDEDGVPISPTNPLPVTPTAGGDVNQPTFMTGQTPVPSPGTAVQLNGGVSLPIPNGYRLVIKAPKKETGAVLATAGQVYIGRSQAEAEDDTVAFPLVKQEIIEYGITD